MIANFDNEFASETRQARLMPGEPCAGELGVMPVHANGVSPSDVAMDATQIGQSIGTAGVEAGGTDNFTAVTDQASLMPGCQPSGGRVDVALNVPAGGSHTAEAAAPQIGHAVGGGAGDAAPASINFPGTEDRHLTPTPLPDRGGEGVENPGSPALPIDRDRPTISGRRLTTAQLEHGALALAKFEAVMTFTQSNPDASWKVVRKSTHVSSVQFCRWRKALKPVLARYADQTLAGLVKIPRDELIEALAKKSPPGKRVVHVFSKQEAAAVKAAVLQSNRNEAAGSAEEAVRHILKPCVPGSSGASPHHLSADTVALLQQRDIEGKPLLTESMRRQVEVTEVEVRGSRTPREAWLRFVQSPGSLQITVDEESGEERMFRPGEAWTMDDGTINFICCVPLERPGDKCWEKFGVMVGRFQFILLTDHRSYFIPGFSYTARPRGSYRAEDLTATVQIACREHGMPRLMFLEHGISASNLVKESFKRAGIRIQHVDSPHQKVVEGVFNKLWTKLSFQPGQVGRHQRDDEEVTKLYMACRAGHKDPRKHFLMLDQVVAALRGAIQDHNGQLIKHSRYGKWVPQEFWNSHAKEQLRPLPDNSAWMFSPIVSAPLTVKGFTVKTTVRIMDGLSQVFHFGAELLQRYHGAMVKLFFNPFLDLPAKVVLAEPFKGERAETVLGDAEMIDRHARLNLRKLGYGEFPDVGKFAVRGHAQALVRSVQSIKAGGQMPDAGCKMPDGSCSPQVARSAREDARPTTSGITSVEVRKPSVMAPSGRNAWTAPSEDEFARTRERLRRKAVLAASVTADQ